MTAAPLLILGVRRSGTTLLRVMLDRHPALAVPDESYFIPQLADRHGGGIDPVAFVDDLRRIPTLLEWGVDAEDVRRRLRPGVRVGDAIGAVYESYAAARGKSRWGDKTPMYMRHLPLLEHLFPEARYVHLVRDGRDAAVSFLQMPDGVVTKTWAHPKTVADFACQWRTEVEAARALGDRVGTSRYLEVRYEVLVESPERYLERISEFAGLAYDPAMLGYAGEVDLTGKPHQQSLGRPPTPGLRNWRRDLLEEDVRSFEAVAGELLQMLGYELATSGKPTAASRAKLASYRARTAAYRAVSYGLRRSPLWRSRHPVLG
ncbi:MAG: sulfotransferase family protein [Gaiellaceae bacterium]